MSKASLIIIVVVRIDASYSLLMQLKRYNQNTARIQGTEFTNEGRRVTTVNLETTFTKKKSVNSKISPVAKMVNTREAYRTLARKPLEKRPINSSMKDMAG